MSLDTRIVDGKGKGTALSITEDGTIGVVLHNHPPLEDESLAIPFRERFTNGSSSSDMNVNGATTNVDFTITANNDYHVFVKTMFVEIGDGGSPTLNKFGALTALANGVEWLYTNDKLGEYQLHDGIKTNKEFIRLGIDTAGIGTGVDAFLADVSGGGTEKSYLPIIDVSETFGMTFGLKLRKGTKDKITFRIKDNLTGLSTFNIIAYGLQI